MKVHGGWKLAVLALLAVVAGVTAPALQAAESAAFTIDTQGGAESHVSAAFVIDTTSADTPGGGGLSAAFVIDTTGTGVPGGGSVSPVFVIDTTSPDPSGGGALSSMFVIDTMAPDTGSMAALSAYFTIDTREDAEKLQYKYDVWVAANTPVGERGMNDVTDLFGISNLLAFALGWEAGDPSTWVRAGIQEVVQTLPVTGVWLRAHRRNDLPELFWTWTNSVDLQGFSGAPALLDSNSTGLGGVMERWDVRVPLPAVMDKHFYRLEIYYNSNP